MNGIRGSRRLRMKSLFVLLSVLLSVASLSFAEEKSGWLDKLKSKAEKIVPAKKTTMTTAVGGVRGAQNDAVDTLYWKGKEDDAPVAEEELEKFNAAIEKATDGKTEESIKGFEEFLKEYPKSSLAADAKKAIEEMKAGK